MDIAKYLKDKSLSDCLFYKINCEYKGGKAFKYFSCVLLTVTWLPTANFGPFSRGQPH